MTHYSCYPRRGQRHLMAKGLGLLTATLLMLSSCDTNSQAQPQPAANHAVDWTVGQSNKYYRPGGDNDCYLLLTLKGGQPDEQARRAPLNISVVLDRSGSMDGDKLRYAQRAVNFLVDQLNTGDNLSVVDYDDVVEILCSQQKVRSKEWIKTKVNALRPRGSTNLHGGTLEGYVQVNTLRAPGYVNRVLLLTDGLANAGIAEPSKIKQMVSNKFNTLGIGLSTFGVGADYNEDLLTIMAETGRGNYYFIDQADKIPSIFAQELKGLLHVVAQNAHIELKLPPNIFCEQVYGYPFVRKGQSVQISFNDLYAEEEKVVLVRLRCGPGQSAPFSIRGSVQYTHSGNLNTYMDDFTTAFHPSYDPEQISQGNDPAVAEMIALYESADDFDHVIEDADRKDYAAARGKADIALKKLKETQRKLPSAKLKAQEAKLEQYISDMEGIEQRSAAEVKMIQKQGKAANYNTKKNK